MTLPPLPYICNGIGEYTADQLRDYAQAAVEAELINKALEWRHIAYARLGFLRDTMPDADVEAVQKFLGPL